VTGSWITGTVWFALHRWVRVASEFGDEHSGWEPGPLKIHGGLAMMAMIFFGYLLATHITVGWRSRRNRIVGLTLVSVIFFQIFTGYGTLFESSRIP
jgi:hypothetical protein